MTYEDTEQGVWAMFYCILDLPEVSRVVQLRPGEWQVYFGDGSEATAYPLEGRFEEGSATSERCRCQETPAHTDTLRDQLRIKKRSIKVWATRNKL